MIDHNELQHAKSWLKHKRNLHPRSDLISLSSLEYDAFCHINGLQNTGGCFIFPMRSAVIDHDHELSMTNLFHEFLGHGLSADYHATSGLFDSVVSNLEAFALWHESKICDITGNIGQWTKKYSSCLPEAHKTLFNHMQDLESDAGELAVYATSGFPLHHQKNDEIEKLIRWKCPQNIFGLVYGSRNPSSDIDLFIVTKDKSFTFFNGWLDIFALSLGDFMHMLKNHDIGVKEAMKTGVFITGDFDMYSRCKSAQFPYTKSSLEYNLEQAERMKMMVNDPDLRTRKTAESYAGTYLLNAEKIIVELKQNGIY